MNDRATGERLPKAQVKKSRAAWLFWIVPIAAAALCFWFIYRDYIAAGPKITLYFETAEGLQENNSPVKYRGVQVGRVETTEVTRDRKKVAVKVRLTGSAANLARVGSQFWIVRPELKVGAVTGLRTIISGEYIAVLPGDGPRTNTFAGEATEPLVEQPGAVHVTVFAPPPRFVAGAIAGFLSGRPGRGGSRVPAGARRPRGAHSSPHPSRICAVGAR